MIEAFKDIWAWWRGVQPSWKERVREARTIDALAERMAEEEGIGERLALRGGKEGRDGPTRQYCPVLGRDCENPLFGIGFRTKAYGEYLGLDCR